MSATILNLILYNPDKIYDGMKDVLREYMKAANPTIKYYFYSYDPSLTTDYEFRGDELLLKGSETFLPGILEKTIRAIEVSLQHLEGFDYIVRTNISTICNFVALARYLQHTPIQYGGPSQLILNWLDPPCGITDARLFGTKYIPGTGIIISREMCVRLVVRKDEIDYSVIDDVALGVFFSGVVEPHALDCTAGIQYLHNATTKEQVLASNAIFFRNKQDDRNMDVQNMKCIADYIVEKQRPIRYRRKWALFPM